MSLPSSESASDQVGVSSPGSQATTSYYLLAPNPLLCRWFGGLLHLCVWFSTRFPSAPSSRCRYSGTGLPSASRTSATKAAALVWLRDTFLPSELVKRKIARAGFPPRPADLYDWGCSKQLLLPYLRGAFSRNACGRLAHLFLVRLSFLWVASCSRRDIKHDFVMEAVRVFFFSGTWVIISPCKAGHLVTLC